MQLQIACCDECVLEEILKDIPDYRLEPWGKMPIWAEYAQKVEPKICVVSGDAFVEALCFEHLFRKGVWGL